jgi:hypothetical protein
LRNPLWLSIDKVIHHDDVSLFIIIGPRNITCSDTHTSDPCVTVGDTEERKSRIARRRWYETAVQQLTVCAENSTNVLEPWLPFFAPLNYRSLIDIIKPLESFDCCHISHYRHKKQAVSDIASYRVKDAGTEGFEVVP